MNGTQGSPVYFATLKITAENTEALTGGLVNPGSIVLYLTSRDYWVANNCQQDHTPAGMQNVIDSLSFPIYEEEENTYIVTAPQLAEIEDNDLFFQSPEFKAFMDSHGPLEA